MATDEKPPPTAELPPTVRYYLFMACAGLLAMGLALFEKIDVFTAIPVLFGALGLLPALAPAGTAAARLARKFPAHLMPPLVVFSLVLVALGYSWDGRGVLMFTDILTCTGLLAYLAGQYRLLGLCAAAVPTDPRPRAGKTPFEEPETWPGALSAPREWPRLAVALPLALILGQLFWYWILSGGAWDLGDEPAPYRLDLGERAWRFASLVWLLGVGAVVLVSFLGVLNTYRMMPDEARMVGQDVLWTETRGEQRRIARWAAWARRRWFRKAGQQP